jgi:hypothetical protein
MSQVQWHKPESLFGRRRPEGFQLVASQAQKFTIPHLNQLLGMVAYACLPSYVRKHEYKDHNPGGPEHKTKP